MGGLSLRTSVTLIALAAYLVGAGVIYLGVARDHEANAHAHAREMVESAVQRKAALVEQQVRERWMGVRGLAQALRNFDLADSAALRPALIAISQIDTAFAWICVADEAGKVSASSNGLREGEIISEWAWFARARNGPAFADVSGAIGSAEVDSSGAPLRLFDMSWPVLAPSGRLVGVIGAHLSWAWVDLVRINALHALVGMPNATALILNKDGLVIAGGQFGDKWLDGRMSLGDYSFVDVREERAIVVAVRRTQLSEFPDFDWSVVVQAPLDAAELSADLHAPWTLLALLCGIGPLFMLASFAGARLAEPFKRLAEETAAFAGGASSVSRPAGAREARTLSRNLRAFLRHHDRRLLDITGERDLDPLTGIFNRRGFFDAVVRAPVSCDPHVSWFVIADIDHFKSINDRLGHVIGDSVLKSVTAILKSELQESDVIGRLGGEEFLIRLHQCDRARAQATVEKMRAHLEGQPLIFAGRRIYVTLSFGVAASGPGCAMEDALTRADEALYRAKARGRNCVVFHDREDVSNNM
jgi:diguanylate cyclase (GGDEF)-like protein